MVESLNQEILIASSIGLLLIAVISSAQAKKVPSEKRKGWKIASIGLGIASTGVLFSAFTGVVEVGAFVGLIGAVLVGYGMIDMSSK
jgi:hypothetical protein